MGKDKLKRFEENKSFSCLFQPDFDEVFRKDYKMKGKWNSDFFGNDNPIVLELGCGRGEYAVELARKFPDTNFLGLDIKGARLWRGAKTAVEEGLKNLAFVRTRIEFIEWLFGSGEVSEIWITFADPQIRRDNKRLTAPVFLDRYRKFLKPNGLIHLKTDSPYLHEYSCALVRRNSFETVTENKDIYKSIAANEHFDTHTAELLSIKTHYEQQFLSQGHPITYLCFRLPSQGAIEPPVWDHDRYER